MVRWGCLIYISLFLNILFSILRIENPPTIPHGFTLARESIRIDVSLLHMILPRASRHAFDKKLLSLLQETLLDLRAKVRTQKEHWTKKARIENHYNDNGSY